MKAHHTTTLAVDLATYYTKPMMIRMAGGEANYNWHQSNAYKIILLKAQSLSPGKNIWDKRTKAYKYMKWHEPRARKEWEKNQ
jgi:hypothetical protein